MWLKGTVSDCKTMPGDYDCQQTEFSLLQTVDVVLEVIPSLPRNLTLRWLDSPSFVAQWTRPANNGNTVGLYVFYYRAQGDQDYKQVGCARLGSARLRVAQKFESVSNRNGTVSRLGRTRRVCR